MHEESYQERGKEFLCKQRNGKGKGGKDYTQIHCTYDPLVKGREGSIVKNDMRMGRCHLIRSKHASERTVKGEEQSLVICFDKIIHSHCALRISLHCHKIRSNAHERVEGFEPSFLLFKFYFGDERIPSGTVNESIGHSLDSLDEDHGGA